MGLLIFGLGLLGFYVMGWNVESNKLHMGVQGVLAILTFCLTVLGMIMIVEKYNLL